METKKLKEVLDLHELWLKGNPKGKLAYLKDAYLKGAYLEGANLKGAYMRGANLKGADLEGANLKGADLKGADLEGANLKGAYMRGAYLEGANLKGAYMRGANLKGAYLEDADLKGADLKGADLEGANLKGAYMRGAYMRGANSVLPHFQICPQEGSFVAYKKTTRGVIKLLIPEDAKRTNSLVGRKCRASKVVVLGGEGVGGTGTHYEGIIYEEGKVIECVDYNGDIRVECTEGIHFFMTEKEAQEWS